MAQPPLLLEESYFDIVSLEAVPDYVPDAEGQPRRHGVEMQLGLATVDDNPDVWRVSLDIAHKAVEEETPRYRFRLRAIGYFRYVADEIPEAEVAQLIATNGASILYSSAREYLLMLTSRTPWGQLSLPTMSFADAVLTPDEA
jgi:preprotein translocase subunit SecB